MLSLPITKFAVSRLNKGYPWIFSRDCVLNSALELCEPGELVQITDSYAKPLGIGTFNPNNALSCRVLATQPVKIDTDFFMRRFAQALKKRDAGFGVPYYRLVHSEGDLLPGLVIDRFGDLLVCQTTTAGMERLKSFWIPALHELFSPRGIMFRDDSSSRQKEGLPLEVTTSGTIPPMPVDVIEHGVTFLADLLEGQKTGWFYDQRENRRHAASFAAGARVADLYSHSGGFGIAAAKAGAHEVTMVDASALALSLSQKAAARNEVKEDCDWVAADIFDLLPQWVAQRRIFDLVIADPPAFIKSREHIAPGLKGYEKLARLCAQITAPGGHFIMASCSHHASPPAFKKAVESGIAASGRSFELLRSAGADRDHPAHPMLPENSYLKILTYRL